VVFMSTTQNMSELMDAVAVDANIFAHRMSSWQTGERELSFMYSNGSDVISKFKISFLPGCAKVLIFHAVTVEPKYRNVGVGRMLHEFRLRCAERVGATTVLCTVLSGNSPEKRILEHFGWKRTHEVTPQVEMWTKELQ
jgi:GNAT superfamily N-acetyltransferase